MFVSTHQFVLAIIIRHSALWLLNRFMWMNKWTSEYTNAWIHSKLLDSPRIVKYNGHNLIEPNVNTPHALETETTVFKWCPFDLTIVSFVEWAYYKMGQFWRLNEVILSCALPNFSHLMKCCETSNLLINSFNKYLLNIYYIPFKFCAVDFKAKLFRMISCLDGARPILYEL